MSNIKPHKIKQIVGKKICIGNDIILTIRKVSQPGERMQVELGVEAPKSVPITLLEFYSDRINAMKKEIASLKNTPKLLEKTKLTIKKSWLKPKEKNELSSRNYAVGCNSKSGKCQQVQRKQGIDGAMKDE